MADSTDMAASEEKQSIFALAFAAVVERRLEAMGWGAKVRLGRFLGAPDDGTASSTTYKLLNSYAKLPEHHFGDVAAFFDLSTAELLREIADWIEEAEE